MAVFGYRPSVKPNILRPGQTICVAAVYNTLGEFKPVAFGAEIDGIRYRFLISIVKVTNEKNGVFIFDCEYLGHNKIYSVQLIFDVLRCIWVIGAY